MTASTSTGAGLDPADEQPADEPAADEPAADEQPADGRAADVHATATALDAFATWAIRTTASRDLSLTTVATLATLSRSGPLRLSELAGREGVTQPSMTALVSRLERDGFATRSADPDDGRAVNVSITRAGREALDARRHRRAATLAALLDEVDGADRSVIAAAAPVLARLAAAAAPEMRPRERRGGGTEPGGDDAAVSSDT